MYTLKIEDISSKIEKILLKIRYVTSKKSSGGLYKEKCKSRYILKKRTTKVRPEVSLSK